LSFPQGDVVGAHAIAHDVYGLEEQGETLSDDDRVFLLIEERILDTLEKETDDHFKVGVGFFLLGIWALGIAYSGMLHYWGDMDASGVFAGSLFFLAILVIAAIVEVIKAWRRKREVRRIQEQRDRTPKKASRLRCYTTHASPWSSMT
jgi:hypothetical protein